MQRPKYLGVGVSVCTQPENTFSFEMGDQRGGGVGITEGIGVLPVGTKLPQSSSLTVLG